MQTYQRVLRFNNGDTKINAKWCQFRNCTVFQLASYLVRTYLVILQRSFVSLNLYRHPRLRGSSHSHKKPIFRVHYDCMMLPLAALILGVCLQCMCDCVHVRRDLQSQNTTLVRLQFAHLKHTTCRITNYQHAAQALHSHFKQGQAFVCSIQLNVKHLMKQLQLYRAQNCLDVSCSGNSVVRCSTHLRISCISSAKSIVEYVPCAAQACTIIMPQ